MKKIFNKKFNIDIAILNIGEFYATKENEGIGTILGSCISACIYEEGTGKGGMNHFLIPGDFRDEEIFLDPSSNYGMYAMELLLGELIKLRVDRSKLRAKIFGGAKIMKHSSKIGDNNIKFIKAFLNMEKIPIISSDVGGKFARKIIFFSNNGKVLVKKVISNIDKIVKQEDKYTKKVLMEI